MSNIYLKVTLEKNWLSQNFDYLRSPETKFFAWGASTHADIIDFKTFYWNLKMRVLGAKLCVAFLSF